MTQKIVLSVFVAFGVFSCRDSPTVSRLNFYVQHALTSDSYDSDGNIFIRDNRIKETYYFNLDLNLGPAIEGQVVIGSVLASSTHPVCYLAPEMSSVCVKLYDGFLLISDKENALLEYAQHYAEVANREDLEPYLFLSVETGITHQF